MTRFFLAAATAMTLGLPAFAGDQYIDETGFAVSGYDVVAYRGLASNGIGSQQTAGVAGQASITAEYNDATFAFSTVENRAKFLENPAFYVPEYAFIPRVPVCNGHIFVRYKKRPLHGRYMRDLNKN